MQRALYKLGILFNFHFLEYSRTDVRVFIKDFLATRIGLRTIGGPKSMALFIHD